MTNNEAAERLRDLYGGAIMDAGGDLLRIGYLNAIDEALAAEHRATVERIRATVLGVHPWKSGWGYWSTVVLDILDAEADR